jgi:hypothetical protein
VYEDQDQDPDQDQDHQQIKINGFLAKAGATGCPLSQRSLVVHRFT